MKKVSYSQFSLYHQCPKRWKLDYLDGLRTYEQSIHTLFGTVMHETIQKWLHTVYEESVKASNGLDLGEMLKSGLAAKYKEHLTENANKHFTTPQQLTEFYNDGVAILEYLRKKRTAYFSTRNTKLVGIEIPLSLKMREGIDFIGFIDLVMYNELDESYTIYDIKTSTAGWNKYAKADIGKTAQLVLYKEFYAKQFGVDVDKVNVEYIIVRRKINEELEFTPKRIQTFSPSSGKPTRNKVLNLFNGFLDNCFTNEGQHNPQGNYPAYKQKLCNYCPYDKSPHCTKRERVEKQ